MDLASKSRHNRLISQAIASHLHMRNTQYPDGCAGYPCDSPETPHTVTHVLGAASCGIEDAKGKGRDKEIRMRTMVCLPSLSILSTRVELV